MLAKHPLALQSLLGLDESAGEALELSGGLYDLYR